MTAHAKLNPIAAIMLYGGLGFVVLAFLGVSGVANVTVWWNSAEGWARYVFTTIGVGAELWGALGLLLMTRRFAQKQWLKAAICLALWMPAVAFNGYSTYRFFVLEGAEVSETVTTEQTALQLADERISEITAELAVIGVTRTPEAITAERDELPDNYRTFRARLDAELATAERRTLLESQLAEQRAIKLSNAGAGDTPQEKTLSENTWIALVIWMEAIKALALWVMFGRVERRSEASKNIELPNVRNIENTPPEAPVTPLAVNERIIIGPNGEKRRVRAV